MMSGACPNGQIADENRTAFGVCLEAARTLVPTRPDPSRPVEGGGLFEHFDSPSFSSPSPYLPTVQSEVWQILLGGLHALSENDHGRPWPYPVRQRLAKLIAEFDADLCRKAAREAREIVVSQDRAPNITNLFEKKLRDLAEVRNTVRRELAAVGGEG